MTWNAITYATGHKLRLLDDSGVTCVSVCACGSSFLAYGPDREDHAAYLQFAHSHYYREVFEGGDSVVEAMTFRQFVTARSVTRPKMKATLDELIAAYREHGSFNAVGRALGMDGSSVGLRLNAYAPEVVAEVTEQVRAERVAASLVRQEEAAREAREAREARPKRVYEAKVPLDDLVAAYREAGSFYSAAKLVGLKSSNVRVRLLRHVPEVVAEVRGRAA